MRKNAIPENHVAFYKFSKHVSLFPATCSIIFILYATFNADLAWELIYVIGLKFLKELSDAASFIIRCWMIVAVMVFIQTFTRMILMWLKCLDSIGLPITNLLLCRILSAKFTLESDFFKVVGCLCELFVSVLLHLLFGWTTMVVDFYLNTRLKCNAMLGMQ